MMKFFISICFSIFFQFVGQAQEPSHFILGEEELAGISIYDLYQDYEKNYWIATNSGIYKYDGYKIKKITCVGMTSNSVFNLKEDYNHNVYCNNLSGQIFQIKNDTCIVYYTIPDKFFNSNISFDFDNLNTLTILSNGVFQVNKNEIETIYEKNTISSSAHIYRKLDSSLIVYDIGNYEFISIKNDKTKFKDISNSKVKQPLFFNFKDSLVAFDGDTKKIISEISESKFVFPETINSNRLTNYYSDNNRIWMANLSGGVSLYEPNIGISKPFFKRKITSAFLKDDEGNILLGTFGEGIIVITNINFKTIKFDENITQIASSTTGDLFFGTQSGRIFKQDSLGDYSPVIDKGIQRIEILEVLEGHSLLITNASKGNLVDFNKKKQSKIKIASIKDIYQIDKNNFLFATNFGVYKYDVTSNKDPELIPELKDRTYSIGYDTTNNTIYCGTATGLKLKTIDSTYLFKYNSKALYCRDILSINDTVYVTTRKQGVFVFVKNEVVANWGVKTGLLSDNTKFLQAYHSTIFVSTELGLNVINSKGQVLKTINKSHGLNSQNIVDFEIVNHTLWIITNKGVQSINLKYLNTPEFKPSVKIKTIFINDEIIDDEVYEFTYEQNKFIFNIDGNTLKYQNDVYYLYQLEGLDKEWVKVNYRDHLIEYKYLPPNNYTFKIKAIYKNEESEIAKYSFKIKEPFWKTWWFYTLIMLGLLSVSFLIFKSKIKNQKHEAYIQHQLDTIQLKALKSQMNPHFIFNSLNSIQELILQQEKESAYNYISKFALLVRKILHHSDKEYIDFEDEVNILKVYLQLEQLRFKKGFIFEIIAKNIADVEIPPMLIQPFVENALKHGLLHKKGDKNLLISFELVKDLLYCTIEDNGIGRQKSNDIKNRQKKHHKSFSVESINTRFEILKNIYGENIGVTYSNLYSNKEDVGTKVILKIPVNRKF